MNSDFSTKKIFNQIFICENKLNQFIKFIENQGVN